MKSYFITTGLTVQKQAIRLTRKVMYLKTSPFCLWIGRRIIHFFKIIIVYMPLYRFTSFNPLSILFSQLLPRFETFFKIIQVMIRRIIHIVSLQICTIKGRNEIYYIALSWSHSQYLKHIYCLHKTTILSSAKIA
jgi:hypothetical protein